MQTIKCVAAVLVCGAAFCAYLVATSVTRIEEVRKGAADRARCVTGEPCSAAAPPLEQAPAPTELPLGSVADPDLILALRQYERHAPKIDDETVTVVSDDAVGYFRARAAVDGHRVRAVRARTEDRTTVAGTRGVVVVFVVGVELDRWTITAACWDTLPGRDGGTVTMWTTVTVRADDGCTSLDGACVWAARVASQRAGATYLRHVDRWTERTRAAEADAQRLNAALGR